MSRVGLKPLWVGLSGQSLALAADHDEVNLYARYGALNFSSMVLAAVVGFFFVLLAWSPPAAHHSDLPRLLAACGAGLLLGRAILAMDQFIVASVLTRGGAWGFAHKVGNFLARGLATVALVFVGTWTLTPLLASHLVDNYLQRHRDIVPTQAERLSVNSARLRLSDQARIIATDQRNLTTAQRELSAEEQGRGLSGIPGCGLACHADTRALSAAQKQLDADRGQRSPLEESLSQAKQAETVYLSTQQAKPIDADVFTRHAALSAIERTNSSVRWLDWLVTFLIGAIDLGPILMKSFSSRSVTDEAVLAARLRKQDEDEIRRISNKEAAMAGARQAAPSAARYQREAFEAEARFASARRAVRPIGAPS
jgi:hypothetical protein